MATLLKLGSQEYLKALKSISDIVKYKAVQLCNKNIYMFGKHKMLLPQNSLEFSCKYQQCVPDWSLDSFKTIAVEPTE